jgi:16S rRNA (cytidine1402-2'-O)-methyltransferase
MEGVLVLAGTPIGQPGDAPPRLAAELSGADVVAAEDTRRLKRLCADLGITLSGRVVSYFEGNEQARTPVLLEALLAGDRVVLVTDAGMPSVSDPGYRLVAAAVATEERTMVFFEAPHRTEAALAAMADALGDDRPAAVCRELTKTHEEVRRGPLAELVAWAADGVRGEVTIVVEGSAGAPAVDTDPGSLRAAVAGLEESGSTRKEAIAEVARRAGLPKREVYDVVHR